MSEWLLVTVEEPLRFYLVPRERLEPRAEDSLPGGDLALRTLDGRRFALSAVDLAVFEVDRARAVAHVDSGVDRLLAPVLDLFDQHELRIFGVTPGEVAIDPEKRRQGRRALLEQAGRLVRSDVSEEDLARVEQRLDEIGDTVRREGQKLWETGGHLSERLEAQVPTLEAAVETAERRVVEFGQQIWSSLRDRARSAARSDEEQ